MRKILVISGLLAIMATQAYAQSGSDMTSIIQGLQSLNNNSTTTTKQPTDLNQLKAAVLTKAGMNIIDTDRNGTVSKTELAATTNKLFDVADSNRDGQLSEQELSTFSANMTKILSMIR